MPHGNQGPDSCNAKKECGRIIVPRATFEGVKAGFEKPECFFICMRLKCSLSGKERIPCNRSGAADGLAGSEVPKQLWCMRGLIAGMPQLKSASRARMEVHQFLRVHGRENSLSNKSVDEPECPLRAWHPFQKVGIAAFLEHHVDARRRRFLDNLPQQSGVELAAQNSSSRDNCTGSGAQKLDSMSDNLPKTTCEVDVAESRACRTGERVGNLTQIEGIAFREFVCGFCIVFRHSRAAGNLQQLPGFIFVQPMNRNAREPPYARE